MDHKRLIKMLEQIALNFAYAGNDDAVAAKVAEHINLFWTATMKTTLTCQLKMENKLSPVALLAIQKL